MLADPQATAGRIVAWIREQFAGADPLAAAVVGVSGGKDSSTVAALCARALGAGRIVGVLLPCGEQPDIDDARLLVATLGIPSVQVNVGESVEALSRAVSGALTGAASDAVVGAPSGVGGTTCTAGAGRMSRDALVNLPARVRMATLYAVAQSLPHGGRVANTCNLSEDYVGYSTKYGDSAGDFSPLAGLLVEEVLQVARALGLPPRLVDKTPSDGLSGKTDEDNLGFTYDALSRYIQAGSAADPEADEKIARLHAANLHKLRPMPSFSLEPGERAPLA